MCHITKPATIIIMLRQRITNSLHDLSSGKGYLSKMVFIKEGLHYSPHLVKGSVKGLFTINLVKGLHNFHRKKLLVSWMFMYPGNKT